LSPCAVRRRGRLRKNLDSGEEFNY
jgi:hypothetical protein